MKNPMWLILVCFIVLAAQFAQAFPSLNDSATYKGTRFDGAGAVIGVFTQKYSLAAFNRDLDLYTVRTETLAEKMNPDIRDIQMTSGSLRSGDLMEIILENCVDAGGEKTPFKVGEEELEVCHLKEKKMELWLANVPFGIARQIEVFDDGSKIELELTEYKLGE